ncbi:MAG: hypothetical protein ACREIV_08960, partial [Planctomycetaceae bacterium]
LRVAAKLFHVEKPGFLEKAGLRRHDRSSSPRRIAVASGEQSRAVSARSGATRPGSAAYDPS